MNNFFQSSNDIYVFITVVMLLIAPIVFICVVICIGRDSIITSVPRFLKLSNPIDKPEEVKHCFKFTTEEESIPPEEEKSLGELLKINSFSKDERNRIIRRAYKNGRKSNELMEDFNLSRAAVYVILQQQPSVIKNPNYERDLKIVKSYNEGKSIVEISKELYLTYATVDGVIRRRKLNRNISS